MPDDKLHILYKGNASGSNSGGLTFDDPDRETIFLGQTGYVTPAEMGIFGNAGCILEVVDEDANKDAVSVVVDPPPTTPAPPSPPAPAGGRPSSGS